MFKSYAVVIERLQQSEILRMCCKQRDKVKATQNRSFSLPAANLLQTSLATADSLPGYPTTDNALFPFHMLRLCVKM